MTTAATHTYTPSAEAEALAEKHLTLVKNSSLPDGERFRHMACFYLLTGQQKQLEEALGCINACDSGIDKLSLDELLALPSCQT